MDDRVRRYLVFFIGIALLTVAVIAFPAGLRFEFALNTTADAPPAQGDFASYSEFSEREQQMIQEAIDGRRYVFKVRTDLPKSDPGEPYIGQLTIQQNNQYQIFTRRTFFEPYSQGGIITIILAVTGLGLAAIAVRRDMRS